jgi:ribosomal protein L11 methyltransferase
LQIGRHLLILPDWLPNPIKDRFLIALDPGMAFGAGIQPTTRLCLGALEDAIHPGDIVVDLGCWSGILSIAAAFLGAGSVLALDRDAATIKTATRNILTETALPIELGWKWGRCSTFSLPSRNKGGLSCCYWCIS